MSHNMKCDLMNELNSYHKVMIYFIITNTKNQQSVTKAYKCPK